MGLICFDVEISLPPAFLDCGLPGCDAVQSCT
jgi:hypothetical protein